MELEILQQLVTTPEKLVEKVTGSKKYDDTASKMYDVNSHDVLNPAKREDKQIKDSKGQPNTISVTRIPVPLQELIVMLRAAFLCGNPIQLSCNPEEGQETELLAIIKKIWDDNKLDYESKGIAEKMMSECEVAEIWYAEPADENYWKGTANEGLKYRFRVHIAAPSLGDSLYPVFNRRGDMIAFGRGYKVREDDKEVEQFDLYAADFIYYYTKGDQGWTARQEAGSDGIERDKVVNVTGKIPVIYYTQKRPEWFNVQWAIDRLEQLLSDHGDTNRYFSSPMVVVEGEVKSFPQRDDNGKLMELKDGAKVQYLTWDQSPESLELEYNNLRSIVFDFSQTPDISIKQMQALGTYSGIALKMLFLSAHLAAARKEEIFGKAIQRRINFLKAAVAVMNPKLEEAARMTIKPKFEYFLPKNEAEMIGMIGESKAGGFLSGETATAQNPLVEDGASEWEKIKEEGKAKASNPTGLDKLFDDNA